MADFKVENDPKQFIFGLGNQCKEQFEESLKNFTPPNESLSTNQMPNSLREDTIKGKKVLRTDLKLKPAYNGADTAQKQLADLQSNINSLKEFAKSDGFRFFTFNGSNDTSRTQFENSLNKIQTLSNEIRQSKEPEKYKIVQYEYLNRILLDKLSANTDFLISPTSEFAKRFNNNKRLEFTKDLCNTEAYITQFQRDRSEALKDSNKYMLAFTDVLKIRMSPFSSI